MSCCSHCRDAGDFFNLKTARRELRHFKKRGPIKSTRLLVDALKSRDIRNAYLLDIGGGVGIIQHELFGRGIAGATQVDASMAYIEVSGEEAKVNGYGDRVNYRFGDFVDLAPELSEADITTLDRVICCYPDMPELVRQSTSKTRCWYGAVYPVDRWYTRWGVRVVNLYFKLTGSDFRVYVHSEAEIDRIIREAEFKQQQHTRTLIWNITLYERTTKSGLG